MSAVTAAPLRMCSSVAMSRAGRFLALMLVAAAAAAQPISAPTPTEFAAALRYGESVNGFPNWAERIVHQWMNRARVDPQAELAQCGAKCPDRACYIALPPLSWSEQLNRAARFHASEQVKQQYMAHDSRCTLVSNIDALFPAGCDGAASCACVGGTPSCASAGCTTWEQRVALFGTSSGGEIIASWADPNTVFYAWLYEATDANGCGFTLQNGHRWLILTSLGSVGVGITGASVGDFSGGATPYKIASGSHYPQQAATVELWANWFDTAAPRSANVVVDGHCSAMTVRRGTAANGAWMTTASGVGTGCHRYYFSFVDSSGAVVTYPATGSLGIGSGSACPDWSATRLQASCSTTTPPSPTRRRAAGH